MDGALLLAAGWMWRHCWLATLLLLLRTGVDVVKTLLMLLVGWTNCCCWAAGKTLTAGWMEDCCYAAAMLLLMLVFWTD